MSSTFDNPSTSLVVFDPKSRFHEHIAFAHSFFFDLTMADYKDPEKQAYDDNGIHPTTSIAQGTHRRASITDAVFGEINGDGPNYRAVCCLYAATNH